MLAYQHGKPLVAVASTGGWAERLRTAALDEGRYFDDTIASVVAVLGSTRRPVEMDRARIDRRIRELALEHAAGTLGDDTYLARLKALRQARDAIADGAETGVPAQRAIGGCVPSPSRSSRQTYRRRGQS